MNQEEVQAVVAEDSKHLEQAMEHLRERYENVIILVSRSGNTIEPANFGARQVGDVMATYGMLTYYIGTIEENLQG